MQPRRLMVPPDAPPERKAQIDELNRAVAGPVLPNTQGARFRGMLVLLQAVPDFDALTLMRDLSENLLSLHWWSVRPPEVLSVRTNVLDPPPGIDAAEVKQGITVAVRKLSGTLDDSEERVRDAATALARLLTAYDLGGDEVKPIEDQRAPEKTVVVRIGAKPLPLSETQRALSATPSAAPR